jgi:hypothetical protein
MLQMEPGKLYQLRNLKRNKRETCMTAYQKTLVNCGAYGWPGKGRRYTDGDVFLCVSEEMLPEYNHDRRAGIPRAYRVLTPAGDIVRVWRDGNKTKFKEVK